MRRELGTRRFQKIKDCLDFLQGEVCTWCESVTIAFSEHAHDSEQIAVFLRWVECLNRFSATLLEVGGKSSLTAEALVPYAAILAFQQANQKHYGTDSAQVSPSSLGEFVECLKELRRARDAKKIDFTETDKLVEQFKASRSIFFPVPFVGAGEVVTIERCGLWLNLDLYHGRTLKKPYNLVFLNAGPANKDIHDSVQRAINRALYQRNNAQLGAVSAAKSLLTGAFCQIGNLSDVYEKESIEAAVFCATLTLNDGKKYPPAVLCTGKCGNNQNGVTNVYQKVMKGLNSGYSTFILPEENIAELQEELLRTDDVTFLGSSFDDPCLNYRYQIKERDFFILPYNSQENLYNLWSAITERGDMPIPPSGEETNTLGERLDLERETSGTSPERAEGQQTSATDFPLYKLWEQALQNRDGTLTVIAKQFLEMLQRNDRSLRMYLPLTPLQQQIFDKCYEAAASGDLDGHPFRSYGNVILAAPTSTGKTTVAELFLAATSLLNTDRKCSLYIAPTRALAQTKWRELREKYKGVDDLFEGTILSTSDDTDDDWRIPYGSFRIACTVYEKANILLSRHKNLLKRLGCLVIDEAHMIADLERGPLLEMFLVKALQERTDIESRSRQRDTLRVITISTEGSSDRAFKELLFYRKSLGRFSSSVPPFEFHSAHRPVPTEHQLVFEPTSTKGRKFSLLSLKIFKDEDERTLNQLELQMVEKGIIGKQQVIRRFRKNEWPQGELHGRLIDLLLALLQKRPKGYRVLVFVPSKSDLEDLARALKNKLRENGRPLDSELEDRFRHIVDRTEDEEISKTILACAPYGIFLHYAELDPKIRRLVETTCETNSPEMQSQVLFATQTLAYGVNLAVDDVVMLGMYIFWRPGIGMRTEKLFCHTMRKIEPVESCLFAREDASVLTGDSTNIFTLPSFAKVFGDAEPPSPTAEKFSNPFVRSVLDTLRHLRFSDQDVSNPEPLILNRIIRPFGLSLYMQQLIQNTSTDEGSKAEHMRLFRSAVEYILRDCSGKLLALVEAKEIGDDTVYNITPRGEAIIDTGIEIKTIVPLFKLADEFQKAWQEIYAKQLFPVELYILCLVAQEEVYRQSIYYTPEMNEDFRHWNREMIAFNRKDVFGSFVASVEKVIDETCKPHVRVLAERLRGILEKSDLGPQSDSYEFGATDSLLRFFNAMIEWIEGEKYTTVRKYMEGWSVPVMTGTGNLPTVRMSNFAQLTERLRWKTVGLTKMLATKRKETAEEFSPDEERGMHMLAQRIHRGCVADAVPMLSGSGYSLDLTRSQVARLLEQKYTPSKILSISHLPKDAELSEDTLGQLRERLEKFAISQLEDLANEATAQKQYVGAQREAIHQLWTRMATLFSRAVPQFRNVNDDEELNFAPEVCERLVLAEGGVRESEADLKAWVTLGSHSSVYRIRIERLEKPSSMIWHEERRADEDQRYWDHGHDVKFIFVQLQNDWTARLGTPRWVPLSEILQKEEQTQHLAIMFLPWLPSLEGKIPEDLGYVLQRRRQKPDYSTAFITPAAFVMMVYSIVRGFTTGEAIIERVAGDPKDQVFGIRDLQKLLDGERGGEEVPPPLREKLICHFEVGV